jgi:hypothetical protein
MANTTTRSTDLRAVEAGGMVAEDVLPRLFNLTPVERPLIDSIGSTTCKSTKKEFVDKVLATPSSTNALAENADLSAIDNSRQGNRYYNWCQQMGKVIKTSQRARDVDLVYDADEFLQQLMDAGEELRMDEEAAMVSRNAATAEVTTGGSEAGSLMAGASTWAIYNSSFGANGGAAATLDGSTGAGGGPTVAPVAGDSRVFTETLLRDTLRKGWKDGARFNLLMSVGDMIETIGNYMFTSSARIATMDTSVPQTNRTTAAAGNGARQGGIVAQGAVNMFVGNFGVVTLTPNRQMEVYDSGDASPVDVCDVLFIDTRYPMVGTLHDYATKTLSQSGLYDQEVVYCDKTFIPGATRSIAKVADVLPTTAMTQ